MLCSITELGSLFFFFFFKETVCAGGDDLVHPQLVFLATSLHLLVSWYQAQIRTRPDRFEYLSQTLGAAAY
ncbi:unnamed protein product [Periconia digitata]|uniref:Secreted protein n=1 Tax=Periconia digitata TaxID=1303443 RepID=A0A9W4XSS2_9PLEO|nr:unnamed protein product [Periconia digitata]